MSNYELLRKATDAIKGLYADLKLHADLQPLRRQVEHLEQRCEFLEAMCGRADPRYRDVSAQRYRVLDRMDQRVQKWMNERDTITAGRA